MELLNLIFSFYSEYDIANSEHYHDFGNYLITQSITQNRIHSHEPLINAIYYSHRNDPNHHD
jgi:hypothetical protein